MFFHSADRRQEGAELEVRGFREGAENARRQVPEENQDNERLAAGDNQKGAMSNARLHELFLFHPDVAAEQSFKNVKFPISFRSVELWYTFARCLKQMEPIRSVCSKIC